MPTGSRIVADDDSETVSVTRVLITGGVTAAVVFILCWVGTLLPFSSPTHAYISFFTNADVGSTRALLEGTVWSLAFGALSGSVLALIYNATAPLGRGKGAIRDEVGSSGRVSSDTGR